MRFLNSATVACAGAIASVAAPLVGILAQRYFGFEGDAARSTEPGKDLAKARALGNALLCFLVIPWTLTLLFYTGTYLPGSTGAICFGALAIVT